MKKSVFIWALMTASFFASHHSYAATQRECLKAIELTKRFEQDSRKAHAAYQQEKSEISRCEFLSKSREHLAQAEETTNICQAYEPELAGKLKADVIVGLKVLDSPINTCNSKTKAELLAEKQCDAARKANNVKDEAFKRTLADYNSNKNKQTQCIFLETSLDYLNTVEKMLRLCEPIFEPSKPSGIPDTRERIQKVREAQTKFCK